VITYLHSGAAVHPLHPHPLPRALVVRVKAVEFLAVDLADEAALVLPFHNWTLQALQVFLVEFLVEHEIVGVGVACRVEPHISEAVQGGGSLLGVLFEHLGDQVAEGGGVAVEGGREGEFSGHNVVDGLAVVL